MSNNNKGKKIFSNKKQLQKIVKLMETNDKIAKGLTKKTESFLFWQKTSVELNNLGPPIKTPQKWARVWIDMKAKLKQKLIKNKFEINETGGKSNTNTHHENLSPFDEKLCKLLNLNVYNIKQEEIESRKNVKEKVESYLEKQFPVLTYVEKQSQISPRLNETLLTEEVCARNDLISSPISDIGKLGKEIKELISYSKKQYYILKDIKKIKEEKLKIYKKYVEKKSKQIDLKLKLREKMITLKEEQIRIDHSTSLCY